MFNTKSSFVPGPGNYKFNSTLTNIKFSIAPKFNDLSQKPQGNPGPGHYKNYASISKDGKYALSKYESSKASNFNPVNSQRFNNSN